MEASSIGGNVESVGHCVQGLSSTVSLASGVVVLYGLDRDSLEMHFSGQS